MPQFWENLKNCGPGKIIGLFLCMAVVSLMWGCSSAPKPVLLEDGKPIEAEVLPDSLRAKFLLTIAEGDGKTQDLDAVLFSVPGKRYRLELTGPLGIGVASMLWQTDGWQMSFPTEKLYMKGNGYMVGLLNNRSLPLVHIHQVAALFEGKVLPESYELVDASSYGREVPMDSSVQVFYGREPSGRFFAFGKREDKVVWLNRIGRDGREESLKFGPYKTYDAYEVPSTISFERDGVVFLEIKVKKIAKNKSFSLGTWRLNIPKSYTLIGQ